GPGGMAPGRGAPGLPDRAGRAGDGAVRELGEGGAAGRVLREPLLHRALFAERHEFLRPAAEELLGTVAEHRLDPFGEEGIAPRSVGLPQVLAGGLRHVAEPLLALGEPRRGALFVCDVAPLSRTAPAPP